MATAGLADIQSNSWGRTKKKPPGATGWRSPPGPTDKRVVDRGQVVAQALALGLVSASSMHKWPRAR